MLMFIYFVKPTFLADFHLPPLPAIMIVSLLAAVIANFIVQRGSK